LHVFQEKCVSQAVREVLRFLRNEVCSNNLRDFGLKKGLDHLDAVRQRFQTITERFAGFQAQCLNVDLDFPLADSRSCDHHVPTPPKTYGLNQLGYDLRKLEGPGTDYLQRDGCRYAHRRTTKGIDVALLFLFFHKRLCGSLANGRFHHKPDPASRPNSKLEVAYRSLMPR